MLLWDQSGRAQKASATPSRKFLCTSSMLYVLFLCMGVTGCADNSRSTDDRIRWEGGTQVQADASDAAGSSVRSDASSMKSQDMTIRGYVKYIAKPCRLRGAIISQLLFTLQRLLSLRDTLQVAAMSAIKMISAWPLKRTLMASPACARGCLQKICPLHLIHKNNYATVQADKNSKGFR